MTSGPGVGLAFGTNLDIRPVAMVRASVETMMYRLDGQSGVLVDLSMGCVGDHEGAGPTHTCSPRHRAYMASLGAGAGQRRLGMGHRGEEEDVYCQGASVLPGAHGRRLSDAGTPLSRVLSRGRDRRGHEWLRQGPEQGQAYNQPRGQRRCARTARYYNYNLRLGPP